MSAGSPVRSVSSRELSVFKEDLLIKTESVGKLAEKTMLPSSKKMVRTTVAWIARARRGAEGQLDKIEQSSKVKKDVILWSAITPVLLVFFLFFSRYFPPLTAFFSGSQLYTSAWFVYPPAARFDDTILTWGTDYIIAAVMLAFTVVIARVRRTEKNTRLILASVLLIGSYSLSTFTGAICHQFLPQKLNTVVFRTFWRICVGCVAAAGGVMGSAASEIASLNSFPESKEARTVEEKDDKHDDDEKEDGVSTSNEGDAGDSAVSGRDGKRVDLFFEIPVVPHFVWIAYAIFFVFANTIGFFSMKQPACDIFCVGVSQVPATVYLVLAIYSRKSWASMNVAKRARRVLLVGALINIVLLPSYDIFNFLRIPLGITNTVLHSTLLFSWGAQAYGLLQFARGVAAVDKHRTKTE